MFFIFNTCSLENNLTSKMKRPLRIYVHLHLWLEYTILTLSTHTICITDIHKSVVYMNILRLKKIIRLVYESYHIYVIEDKIYRKALICNILKVAEIQ